MSRYPSSCPVCGLALQRTPTGGPGIVAHYDVVHPDRDVVADNPWIVEAFGPLLQGLVEGPPPAGPRRDG